MNLPGVLHALTRALLGICSPKVGGAHGVRLCFVQKLWVSIPNSMFILTANTPCLSLLVFSHFSNSPVNQRCVSFNISLSSSVAWWN